MTNNDVLRSIRYMLKLNDEAMVNIAALADSEVPLAMMQAYLKKEEEAGFQPCPDVLMGYFLNGLIFHRRGKSEELPAPSIERKMNNNIILKKLRIAFDLKTTDIPQVLAKADFAVGQSEIGAIFRKPDHKNYRECGDQLLRNFLKGLSLTVRPPIVPKAPAEKKPAAEHKPAGQAKSATAGKPAGGKSWSGNKPASAGRPAAGGKPAAGKKSWPGKP